MALYEETLAEYRIFDIRILPTVNYENDLEWICRSFGFLEPRDKRKTAYRIFKEIVEAARYNKGLTSDELAQKLHLTRGTIVHHLNKMIKSGLVIHKVAETIDQTLGLFFREREMPARRLERL